MFDPRYYIIFTASNGITLRVLAGGTSAALTAGFGGWESVDRPKRVAISRWNGRPLFKQDIPVMFDGYADGTQQETEIAKLVRMTQPTGALQPPPTIKIKGPIDREDITWVIEDITWDTDSVIRDMSGGSSVRVRQGATVHLMQFLEDTVIVTPAKPQLATKVVDGAGKTPKQLSQEIYGSPDFWTLFTGSNLTIAHPRQKIPKGTKVIAPPRVKIF